MVLKSKSIDAGRVVLDEVELGSGSQGVAGKEKALTLSVSAMSQLLRKKIIFFQKEVDVRAIKLSPFGLSLFQSVIVQSLQKSWHSFWWLYMRSAQYKALLSVVDRLLVVVRASAEDQNDRGINEFFGRLSKEEKALLKAARIKKKIDEIFVEIAWGEKSLILKDDSSNPFEISDGFSGVTRALCAVSAGGVHSHTAAPAKTFDMKIISDLKVEIMSLREELLSLKSKSISEQDSPALKLSSSNACASSSTSGCISSVASTLFSPEELVINSSPAKRSVSGKI